MSDKKNENDLSTDTSWKKRIKQSSKEKKESELQEKESDLQETEPFVDVKLTDLDIKPYKERHIDDSETQAFVDIQINNSQLSKIICKKCGYHVKEENLYFCPKCGKRLKNSIFDFRR
ncbi:MAG: hypothetical protein ACTSPN_10305 [Promethearchaeota archaeon]